MSAVITKASPLDIGCWIEGHRGHYATSGLVWKACDWGFEIDDSDRLALEAYEAGNDEIFHLGEKVEVFDWVVELADEAEAWLNDHVAPEGHSFGWMDCEFYLWTDEEWAEDGL